VPEMVRFKCRAFLSYSHPYTRSTDITGLQAELEAAFRKLPIAPPADGRIPYEWVIPGIGRQLALMKPVDRKVASPDATKRKLAALKKLAKILCEDMSAMALLPLKPRILIVEIAHAENPKLPPPGRGAPQKSLAMQVARIVAEHFYGPYRDARSCGALTFVCAGSLRSSAATVLPQIRKDHRIVGADNLRPHKRVAVEPDVAREFTGQCIGDFVVMGPAGHTMAC
jgi:hypothetical protein